MQKKLSAQKAFSTPAAFRPCCAPTPAGGPGEPYPELRLPWIVIPWGKDSMSTDPADATVLLCPTQLPLLLAIHLLRMTGVAEGDVVDPFAGLCTAGVAATLLERSCWCFETERSILQSAISQFRPYASQEMRHEGMNAYYVWLKNLCTCLSTFPSE